MRVAISPSSASGTISAPPSKSYAHRLMICAALACGQSTVRGIAESQDMLATLDCIGALGAKWSLDGDVLIVEGCTPSFSDGTIFPCRESGSTLRFLMPLAAICGSKAIFTGTERLISRGVGVYDRLFSEKGIGLARTSNVYELRGPLQPGEFKLEGNVSSQFISGLLFALPLLDGDSAIEIIPPVESRPYIDITIDALSSFGIEVRRTGENRFEIPGNQSYSPAEIQVEGDWSNAAFLHALNALGSSVEVTGLNGASLQGDRFCIEAFAQLDTQNVTIDIANCPDLGPVLFAVAAAKGGATFTGTRRLRIKESDRAAAMASELAKFGVSCIVEENSVTIGGGGLGIPTEPLQGHNDHRIVMSLALLASVVGGEIEGAEAVSKSYPGFFDDLASLGLEITYGA
ncbi:MAG: 3-phosphoshikimate 1-carboxyvinyltransferase [bacterium]|nr:3-phosphoshikimate 1-carboxyvinyltransferase [bacterium]